MIHLYSTKYLESNQLQPLPEKCIYLGVNYRGYVELRENHPSLQTLGDRFQQKLKAVEDDFLLMMNQYVQDHGSKAWTNPISSRNSSGSPLLRNILYALCALDIVRENKDCEIAFICESGSVAEWLSGKLKKEGVRRHLSFWERQNTVSLFFIYLKRILSFFLDFNSYWFASRFFLKKSQWGKNTFVLRSWVNKDILSGKNYEDRNFGELGDFLEENGKNVIYAPLFFNLGCRPLGVVRQLGKFNKNIVIAERHVSWFSWVSVIGNSFYRFLDKNYSVARENISLLVKGAHYDSFFNKSDLQNLVFTKMLEKVKSSGGDLERFIYTFENNTVEKNTILVVRSLFKNCEIIGFQHSVWYKNQLGMKLASKEAGVHPVPDKIVTSGKKYKSILKSCGFPEEIIVEGPNLRFSSMNELKSGSGGKLKPENGNFVLVVLNFDINQNLEILEKIAGTLRAFGKRVKIKNHPLVNRAVLDRFLEKIQFPEYSFAEGRVSDLVNQSLAVIMPACSVSNLEVLCYQKPLIRVSLSNDFNFDPVWEDEDLFSFSRAPNEILTELRQAEIGTHKEVENREHIALNILETYFSEVSQKNMSVFLD